MSKQQQKQQTKQEKAEPARKSGSGRNDVPGTDQAADGAPSVQTADKEFIYPAPKVADDAGTRRTFITSTAGEFQLRAERDLPDGTVQQPWMLRFANGAIDADEETADAVRQVIAGEWRDGRVGPRHFQQLARLANLQVVREGLETSPMATWDALSPEAVVPVAKAAGLLLTDAQVLQALRYEKQGPDRSPATDPRPQVVAQLEAELHVLQAAQVGPVPPASADAVASVAAAARDSARPTQVVPSNDSDLTAGEAELQA